MADKKTVKQFAEQLRRDYDLDKDKRPDEKLVSDYMKKHPEALDQVERVQTRPPRGSPMERYWKGLTEQFKGPESPLPSAFGMPMMPTNVPTTSNPPPDPNIGGVNLAHPSKSFNLPGIGESMEKGDIAGAIGKATLPAVGIAGIATGLTPEGGIGGGVSRGAGALGEMEEIGTGTVVDKAAMDVAKVITKPISQQLDSQLASIDNAMSNQYINAQRLTAGIAHAKNVIAKLEHVPDAKVGDVAALREAVSDLDKASTANKNMPWADARHALQRINKAAAKVKGGGTAIDEVKTALKDELKTSAKPVIGDVYDNWVDDYRSLSRVQRAHAKAIKGTTPKQMQQTPTESMLKRYSKLGRSVADKKALLKREMINKSQQAIDQLGRRVRGRTKPPAQPPQGPLGQPPPTQPPSGGGAPKPPTGGQGGGPMSGLVDKVLGRNKPVSETQQAINELLKAVQRPPLPKNVVVGEEMGSKITQPRTGPAKVLQMPPKKQGELF